MGCDETSVVKKPASSLRPRKSTDLTVLTLRLTMMMVWWTLDRGKKTKTQSDDFVVDGDDGLAPHVAEKLKSASALHKPRESNNGRKTNQI